MFLEGMRGKVVSQSCITNPTLELQRFVGGNDCENRYKRSCGTSIGTAKKEKSVVETVAKVEVGGGRYERRRWTRYECGSV